jgi:hypothetical protein
MRKIAVITLSLLTTSAYAGEYESENYEGYGYGSAASVLQGSELKAGQRGHRPKVHKDNLYTPGFTAGDPVDVAQWLSK